MARKSTQKKDRSFFMNPKICYRLKVDLGEETAQRKVDNTV